MRRPAPWQVQLTGGAVLCLLYAFVPPLKGNGLVMNLLGLSPVVATFYGVRLHRPRARAPWLWCAAGMALFWFGDLYTVGYSRLFDGEVPFPSIGDAAYIGVYPLMMIGLIMLVRRRNPERDGAGAIDSVIITVGLSLMSWLWLISPYLRDDTMSGLARSVSVAYPIGDIMLLAAIVRLAVDSGRRDPAFRFMTASVLALLVTDFAYGLITLAGEYHDQIWLDVGWISFYVLWGTAALHPSMRSMEEPGRTSERRVSRQRLALLGTATLVAPVLAILRNHGDIDLVVIAAGAALIFLLVVSRMAGLVRLNERAAARERILSSAGTALVAATDRAQAAAVTIGAARELLGADADVRLVGADAAIDAGESLRLPLAGGDVLVVRTTRSLTRHTRDALDALVSQVSMALEAADLNEEVARRRSEARFASLVRHSSDLITVLSADGTISYQSPSVERVLGYAAGDIVGHPFHELLDPTESGALARLLAESPRRMATVECGLRHRDGSVRRFEVQYTDLLDEEHVRGIVLNARDISERKAFEDQLAHQAFHDPVTNLANRALFVERVRHAVAQSLREGHSLAVLFFDLDDFKTINDSLGHAAGDQVLLEVGKRLASSLRASDTAARFGGDEFAVLLEAIESDAHAAETAERLLEALAVPFTVAQREISLRSSLGIAVLSRDGSGVVDAEELIRNADAAMYSAKRDGKGVYRMFEPAMHEGVLARLELKGDLQRALSRDEFELHYQPLVRLKDGEVTSFEALLRWNHPDRGQISPDQFIPFAEETGLIVPIGRWVLREGCRQAVAFQRSGAPDLGMAINLSVKQLQHSDVAADVAEALAESGLDPALLTIEITESVVMADTELAVVRLRELKQLGVRLAMDDFGTGYSSLSYLSRFPVDILKMDRSFLRSGGAMGHSQNLAEAVIGLGTTLELEVVAEGIEDPAQRENMRSLGAHVGQGFLFAEPMPAADVFDFLRSEERATAAS